MATSKQQENMLLTEHFTWPPISLIDEIINSVNDALYSCTDSLETGLFSADPSLLGFPDRAAAEKRMPEKDEEGHALYPEAKLEIEEGMLKLETLMENAVDRNFDKLEIYTLRNILCLRKDEDVAEWIRLGHYENLTVPPPDSNITHETLHALRRKLQETQKLYVALLAEKMRNEAQIQRLHALLQPSDSSKRAFRVETSPTGGGTSGDAPFAFLTHIPAAQDLGVQALPLSSNCGPPTKNNSGHTPLMTHTTFTTSEIPHLRQLLAALKPHLATKALPTRSEGEKEDLARERKIYIESQSKRVLERRGINTDDGVDGAVEGQRVRSEEVRGLEGIIQSLIREKGDTKMDADVMDTA